MNGITANYSLEYLKLTLPVTVTLLPATTTILTTTPLPVPAQPTTTLLVRPLPPSEHIITTARTIAVGRPLQMTQQCERGNGVAQTGKKC
ncbi:hypothetical protein HQ545_07975 [Candidatus Woesearchaeota archaeon]|nr:hypothetical protein [Candidatus Woesearchaeota archaeon]